MAKRIRFLMGGIAALFGVALVVAACGGGSTTSSSASAPATSAGGSGSATVANASAKGVAIRTMSGPAGTYLVGPSGRALYLWVADHGDMSNCSGACAVTWPPLTTKSAPIASHGVRSADLGTTTRSGATKQVTYKGHPLYYYAGDTTSAQTTGQGSDSFGAKWWLVAPAGAAITGSGSSGAAASSSSSASGY